MRRALAWLATDEGEPSPESSAYCQARMRLPEDLLDTLARQVVERLAREAEGLWYGKPVKVVDGTTVSMPDTIPNQEQWPQSEGQKPGCGFPVMRLVALFSLASGALLAHSTGSQKDAELTLWRKLWDQLSPGDVVLGDRNFSSYADLGMLLGQGVDCVVRMNAKRSTGSRIVEKLGPGEYLVEWKKTGGCPDWMSKEDWARMPETLLLRQITYNVPVPGFRTESVTVVTTLLDRKRYPASAFAELYLRRWKAEIFIRDLKITMRMDVLRTKSPAMIRKELKMHLLAYNLVRGLMVEAARRHGKPPGVLSFKKSLEMVRTWAPVLVGTESDEKRALMEERLLRYLARSVVRPRPGRSEPRAKKRRPKNYQLMNKPRSEFKEIPHRNRYTKPEQKP